MLTRVVTLSHATGSGGETIGRTVAKSLGFRYIDEEVINIAAQREGIDAAVVADEERRKSFLERLMAGIAIPVIGEASASMILPEAIVASGESLRTLIVEAIHEVAEQGQAVIVSHAASIPLADRPDVLRILVTASVTTRAQRAARDGGVAVAVAAGFIKENDAGRADYFQRFYRIERELPTHYDLVINTDKLSADEVADIIVAAVKRHA
ncbi:MAG TPA: cytidylate kinase-like family protein [Verrucomicrobiae bacterium]|jgi:cytidylate kinase|nr:cytidylate kinase-like family protein [Verrucomicrobiae bacterium]